MPFGAFIAADTGRAFVATTHVKASISIVLSAPLCEFCYGADRCVIEGLLAALSIITVWSAANRWVVISTPVKAFEAIFPPAPSAVSRQFLQAAHFIIAARACRDHFGADVLHNPDSGFSLLVFFTGIRLQNWSCRHSLVLIRIAVKKYAPLGTCPARASRRSPFVRQAALARSAPL